LRGVVLGATGSTSGEHLGLNSLQTDPNASEVLEHEAAEPDSELALVALAAGGGRCGISAVEVQ
jgi:hypothetical protein